MFEAGGIKNPLFFIGMVEDHDNTGEHRVRVRAFGVHGTQTDIPTRFLPWAKCVAGNYSNNNPLPPLNSLVWGIFLDGRDSQQPMVLGLIPTSFDIRPDHPEADGIGVYPDKDGHLTAKGSDPESWGQPPSSRLLRGENLDETYILAQEMSRVENVKIANSADDWDEPPPAYNAKWPHNKIWETSKHVIELDDTDDAERIMIWHKEGSYIQMDSSGNVTYKSNQDKFDLSIKNSHVYVGGQSHIHVAGDATTYVKGNQTTEVLGDYKLLVHGNAEFGVGGQMALNASDQLAARAAEVRIAANVSNMSLYAKRSMKLQAGESWHQLAPYTKQTSLISHNVQFGPDGYNLFGVGDFNAAINNLFIDAAGTVPTKFGGLGVEINSLVGPAKFQSSTYTSIYGGVLVEVDNLVNLAGRLRDPSFAAGAVGTFVETLDFAELSQVPKMPEPPSKNTAFVYRQGSSSSAGVTSGAGHGSGTATDSTRNNTPADIVSNKSDSMKPILDMISSAESRADGYDALFYQISDSNKPGKPVSQMTVGEVLDYQRDLIDRGIACKAGPPQCESESTAIGRYQFISSTLKRVVDKGYISRDEIFDSATQDRAAVGLLEMDGSLNRWLDGEISDDKFQYTLAGIWAGIPDPNTGASRYGGVGSNKSTITSGPVQFAISDARTRYNALLTSQQAALDNVDKHIAVNLPDVFDGLG
jgi:hypothetical protein